MTPGPRLLLVGPLPIQGDVIGGTKVSFAGLVEGLEEDGRFDLRVHNISRARNGRGLLRRALDEASSLARLLGQLLNPRQRFDGVMLNISSGGLMKSGALVWLACRLRRTPLAVRVFGGDLDLFFESASAPSRWLTKRTILRADQVLLQTQALCERFADDQHDIRWWPTTRDVIRPNSSKGIPTGARRFLFLGQLRAEKGIREAVAAAACLPPDATLSIYGPAMPGFELDSQTLGERCVLHGPVPREQVPSVLAEHDALVFPTYHRGEGMPGIVIEAMQCGLPVIATRWRSIPELVEDGVNGLLVEPRDPGGLGRALARLMESDSLFQQMRMGAQVTGERFRQAHWQGTLVNWLYELTTATRGDPSKGAKLAPSLEPENQ